LISVPAEADIPAEVLAIFVYGSVARGDADRRSDVDVLLITTDVDLAGALQLRHWCGSALAVETGAVGLYTMANAAVMADHGSPLLWHLKLEGRALFDRGGAVERLFRRLMTFRDYAAELLEYEGLLDDVRGAWDNDRGPSELDLHVLHLVIRNTCILLSFLDGAPTFGRTSAAYDIKRRHRCLPLDETAYEELTEYHLLYVRGQGEARSISREACETYLEMARAVVEFAKCRAI